MKNLLSEHDSDVLDELVKLETWITFMDDQGHNEPDKAKHFYAKVLPEIITGLLLKRLVNTETNVPRIYEFLISMLQMLMNKGLCEREGIPELCVVLSHLLSSSQTFYKFYGNRPHSDLENNSHVVSGTYKIDDNWRETPVIGIFLFYQEEVFIYRNY